MADQGYKTIQEMRGITLGQILTWDKVDRETRAISVSDPEKCNGCRDCEHWCFYGAISYTQVNGKTKCVIDPNKCDGCGLCASLCRRDAIHMEGPKPVFLGDFN